MNLEVKPYAIAGLATDLVCDAGAHERLSIRDAGFDVKYGLTKSITADFTYNTDFAQVEDDEAQVNLTRFSLSFPEKREFFLEGRGHVHVSAARGGVPTIRPIFYSRRIGLSGGRPVPIVAGGRLTGKAGNWNIGALSITTDDDEVVQARADELQRAQPAARRAAAERGRR